MAIDWFKAADQWKAMLAKIQAIKSRLGADPANKDLLAALPEENFIAYLEREGRKGPWHTIGTPQDPYTIYGNASERMARLKQAQRNLRAALIGRGIPVDASAGIDDQLKLLSQYGG